MGLMNWARAQWDRVSGGVLIGFGALVLGMGWIGVSGTPHTFEQIPFVVSGGLGGLFLLGVGAMLWVSADLRDVWRKLDELNEILARQIEDDGSFGSPPLDDSPSDNGATAMPPARPPPTKPASTEPAGPGQPSAGVGR